MSPAAIAPSSASVKACSSTSPSEWPASPLGCGNRTPPIFSGMPGLNSCESQPNPMRGTRTTRVLNDTRFLFCEAGFAADFLGQEELGQLQVAGSGDFQVARRAHHDMHRVPGSLNQRGLVRSQKPIRGRLVERLLEESEAEA